MGVSRAKTWRNGRWGQYQVPNRCRGLRKSNQFAKFNVIFQNATRAQLTRQHRVFHFFTNNFQECPP